MKLDKYLKENNLTQMAFIHIIKEKTGESIPQGTLAKYILSSRIPQKKQMKLIYAVTKGAVSPNDFYLD